MLPEIGGMSASGAWAHRCSPPWQSCLFQALQTPGHDPKLSLQSGSQKSHLPCKEVGSYWFKSQQIIFKAMHPIMDSQVLILNSYQISPLGNIKNNLCVRSFHTSQLWWYPYFIFCGKDLKIFQNALGWKHLFKAVEKHRALSRFHPSGMHLTRAQQSPGLSSPSKAACNLEWRA